MNTMHHAALLPAILLSLFLASCAKDTRPAEVGPNPPARITSSGIGPQALQGLDARGALAQANKWGTATPEVQSYVDTQAVIITFKNSGKTVEVPLPEDQIVVAFAPYISKTHPCEIHYMSGCQGELVETTVKVTAILADGAALIEEEMTTMKNGFLELWLPRNQEITVTMEALGRKAEGTVGTFSNSNTCITTFQLL
jgi:hypothetical protein